MAYIFIVKYSVLFGLFNFGLGLELLNLASASALASSIWPRLTYLVRWRINHLQQNYVNTVAATVKLRSTVAATVDMWTLINWCLLGRIRWTALIQSAAPNNLSLLTHFICTTGTHAAISVLFNRTIDYRLLQVTPGSPKVLKGESSEIADARCHRTNSY